MLVAASRGTGVVPMVRVPRGEYHFIARALDVGAQGIMVPMVESVAQARDIAQSARYPRQGRRGAAFGFAHDDYAPGDPRDKMKEADRRNFVIAQIETERGLEAVEEIAGCRGHRLPLARPFRHDQLSRHSGPVRPSGLSGGREADRGRRPPQRQGTRLHGGRRDLGPSIPQARLQHDRHRHRPGHPDGRHPQRAPVGRREAHDVQGRSDARSHEAAASRASARVLRGAEGQSADRMGVAGIEISTR